MGQLIGHLTNPQLASAGAPAPSTSQIGGDLSSPAAPSFSPQEGQAPQMARPSFLRAANTGPAGTPNAMSPGLTKGGKLAVLLMSGLKGAIAGQAANEQTAAATGGRRAGGFGTAFQAGMQQPYQQASMPLGVEQQQTEVQMGKAGLAPVETPYGNMPAAFASKLFPAMVGAQGKVESAQIGAGAKEKAAQVGGASRVAAAQIGADKPVVVPGLGAFQKNSQTGKYEAIDDAQLPSVRVTRQEAHALGHDELADTELPFTQYTALLRGTAFGSQVVQGEAGPSIVQRNPALPGYGQSTSLGLGNPSLGRPVQVGDVNNPGQTTFTTGGQAIKQGAPGTQSASVQVPRTAAKAEVPTKIGDQKVAFTTAIQHAQLLEGAARAMQNGDVQTLSGLENRFRNEFGQAGPVTAQAIADAYTREVTKMLSAGHLTDSEIATVGKTLNPNKQNMKQVMGVIGAYRALSQSKLNMLNQQKQNAIQQSQPKGKTNGGTPATQPGVTHIWTPQGLQQVGQQ